MDTSDYLINLIKFLNTQKKKVTKNQTIRIIQRMVKDVSKGKTTLWKKIGVRLKQKEDSRNNISSSEVVLSTGILTLVLVVHKGIGSFLCFFSNLKRHYRLKKTVYIDYSLQL